MNKVIDANLSENTNLKNLNPIYILNELLKYRELIFSMTIQNFRANYQASYLGTAWQIILPLIMFSIFYFVFGVILGGRFSSIATESRLDYALALFVGLGIFNFLAQNLGAATSLIISNLAYVKSIAFPLEILSVTSVLTSFITLCINISISIIIFFLANGKIYLSSFMIFFYLMAILLMTMGVSWIFSAIAVFFRDLAAIISPITIILMFMCPIFYPISMVPKKVKWLIEINPLAIIIEQVRNCLLYGIWPNLFSLFMVMIFSLLFAMIGYWFFMRSKMIFADLL